MDAKKCNSNDNNRFIYHYDINNAKDFDEFILNDRFFKEFRLLSLVVENTFQKTFYSISYIGYL